jgi:hypothetical protein
MAAGNTYEAIFTDTLASAQASVTFSSIPSTYTDLVLVFSGSATATSYVSLQYNSDTGSNYSTTLLRGNGTAASSVGYSTQTEIFASISATNTTAINNVIFQIQNYSNTTTYKTNLSRANNAGVSTEAGVGLWRSTAAINAIKVLSPTNNFAAGSTFSLYGIKAA